MFSVLLLEVKYIFLFIYFLCLFIQGVVVMKIVLMIFFCIVFYIISIVGILSVIVYMEVMVMENNWFLVFDVFQKLILCGLMFNKMM